MNTPTDQNKIDLIGSLLIASLLISLTYAGILAYKSIDFKILDKLEASPLDLPPQPTSTPQTPQSH